MKIRGLGRLRTVVRRVTNLFVPRAIILLYHRVTELTSDPQLLCVSRQHFAEHLEIMRKHGRLIGLNALDPSLRRRETGRPAVVTTFDDGYADNLYNAKPLLERHDVPATVFISTGYVGSQREFWFDDLERLLLQPRTLPKTLRISVNDRAIEWELGSSADCSEDSYRRHRFWNVLEKNDPTPRHALYRSIYRLLLFLPEHERRSVLDQLSKWAAAGPVGRPTHRVLSPDEILHLADGGLVDIGSHTATHPVLSALSVAEQREELSRSKARLEEILSHPVATFAYPYGAQSHYTPDTVAVVREAGYKLACSNFNGIVRQSVDPWQLPRFLVRDWDGDEFSRRLGGWLSG